MVEVTIHSIRVSPMNYQHVVILKEATGEHYLPIWIGPAEANAIGAKLQGGAVPRSLTHDLLYSVIEALGAKVNSVIITDLRSDTFYAKIILNVDGQQIEVDSRPSDAVALAIRAEVPMYVEEAVLDKAGVLLDEETGRPIHLQSETGRTSNKTGKVSQDDLRRMSAFTDFFNTLDLDDFGKRRS